MIPSPFLPGYFSFVPERGPDGELLAVVGSDLFLHAMEEAVADFVADGGYVWIVNKAGHVI